MSARVVWVRPGLAVNPAQIETVKLTEIPARSGSDGMASIVQLHMASGRVIALHAEELTAAGRDALGIVPVVADKPGGRDEPPRW